MEARTDTLTPGSATRPGGNTPQAQGHFLGVTPALGQGKGGVTSLEIFNLEDFLRYATSPVAICYEVYTHYGMREYRVVLTALARFGPVVLAYRERYARDLDGKSEEEHRRLGEETFKKLKEAAVKAGFDVVCGSYHPLPEDFKGC